MTTRDDDLALAAKVVRGEAGAADALFERVFDRLYASVCSRLGGDHDVAQDIVSESLIAGLRALPGFRGEATLVHWFSRIASRKIVDRKRRHALYLVDDGDGALDSLLLQTRPQAPAVVDRLADEETRILVQEALDSLPSRHRDVLEWKYYDDSSLGQMAQRLNVTAKAAERRLARARRALATALRRRGVGRGAELPDAKTQT